MAIILFYYTVIISYGQVKDFIVINFVKLTAFQTTKKTTEINKFTHTKKFFSACKIKSTAFAGEGG
jgi:hypothetical protein